jgi:hypothetical protein
MTRLWKSPSIIGVWPLRATCRMCVGDGVRTYECEWQSREREKVCVCIRKRVHVRVCEMLYVSECMCVCLDVSVGLFECVLHVVLMVNDDLSGVPSDRNKWKRTSTSITEKCTLIYIEQRLGERDLLTSRLTIKKRVLRWHSSMVSWVRLLDSRVDSAYWYIVKLTTLS